MEHDETGCQPPPEGPILCINNCGFFGSAATMNMCSKCHKDVMMKDQQAKLAASSIENIVNGGSTNGNDKEPPVVKVDDVVVVVEQPPKAKAIISLPTPPEASSSSEESSIETKPKPMVGPSRCSSCKKRVGLTGFKCKCGDLFCGSHRYSDKHDCSFDYRTAGRDAIAKANPVVKAEKLEKI